MKKEIQAGKSYDSKRRNALKHVRRAISYFDLGKMDKARLWLLKTEKILDEFKHEYDLASIDQTSVVKFKEVIQLEEDIDSATEATEAPKAIEVLTEIANEVYADEAEEQNADGSEEDYSSQTKKDSRTFAFSRTDISGNPITKAIKCGLFITHTKMRDIVQAWNEGLVDKNTQLVLVTSGSDVVDGKKVKVVNHISENFDKQLEETTKEMCYDEVPNFIKRPRFWGRAITSLKVDSKSSLNEDGLVWGDLKGSIQYAFLDYCGMNNMKYLNWYQDVLYEMLANNYNLAINHFSYVRNDKTNWRDRCIAFLECSSRAIDAIGCQRFMEQKGNLLPFFDRYAELFDCFKSPFNMISAVASELISTKMKYLESELSHITEDSRDYSTLNEYEQKLYTEKLSIEASCVWMRDINSSSKKGLEVIDNILIDAVLWKCSYLDIKNPQSMLSTPKSCLFMGQLNDYHMGRISGNEAVELEEDDKVNYMTYSGNKSSSKMTIHKFVGSKKPVYRCNKRIKHTIKELQEHWNISHNPFRPTVVVGVLGEGDYFNADSNIEDQATLKINGLTDGQSRKFVNDYCVKRERTSPTISAEFVTKNCRKKPNSIAVELLEQALMLGREVMDEIVAAAWKNIEENDSVTPEDYHSKLNDVVDSVRKAKKKND